MALFMESFFVCFFFVRSSPRRLAVSQTANVLIMKTVKYLNRDP